jgi:6-phosphogluconolactonase
MTVSPRTATAGDTSPPPASFVYVSSTDGGDIRMYRLRDGGALEPGPAMPLASPVGPMASSADGRFLYAATRAQPYRVHAFAIDERTGALTSLSATPLPDTYPYIALDRTGRFLLGASYAGSVVSVHAVGRDGRVAADATQVFPVGRNAHAIGVDRSNRFAYVPALGTDQIFQFTFDATTGRLRSNTPPAVLLPPDSGPRHFVISGDNRFLYALSEFLATVTTFAIDAATGLLTELATTTTLPPDTPLVRGAPRGGTRNADNDIWAADIHLTPDGTLMYVSERTSSVIAALRVDPASGTVTLLSSTPTERQPRGFAIDPTGRFLIAAGEKSASISVHAIDASTGALALLDRYPAGKGANWVEIVRAG